MLVIIIVIVSLVLLIIGHELGHFFAAKAFGIDVPEFGIGFPPRIAAKKLGRTEYSINWLPFGGFVRILGEDGGKLDATTEEKKRSFAFKPAWKRSIVVLAGVIINFIIGWLILSAVLMIGTPPLVAIESVQDNSPAVTAGLKAGDVIVGYSTAKEFVADVNAHKGGQLEFDIVRGSETVHISANPKADPKPGGGALGVGLSEGGAARENPLRALWDGLLSSGIIAWSTILGFIQLIKTALFHVSLPQDVVGPVGIFGIARQAGGFGIIYLVQLMSIISINLAILNLIPFPALDGGRFVMILVEKIKGSPVSKRVEGAINAIGFLALLVLMVAVTARDIVRLF